MKMPGNDTLRELCADFGFDPESLRWIGGGREDSDGVAYRVDLESGPVVFKAVSFERERTARITDLDARMAFARFLGEGGVRVARPIPLRDGSLYASRFEGDTLFAAYATPFFDGVCPNPALQTPALARAWGALTGRAHAVTQEYPLWRTMNNSPEEYDYRAEIAGFLDWAEEEPLKARWRAMRKELDALPKSRDSYGFIHNDNHEQNLIASGETLALIDFDVANCQFFMNDIVTPMQGLFFEIGGMCEPVKDENRLHRFLEAFLEGYETQYHIGSEWLSRIDLFVRYRRLLLATVLQGLCKQNPGLRDGFYRMMDAPGVISL